MDGARGLAGNAATGTAGHGMGVTVAAVVFATPIYTTGRQLQADTGFLARGFFFAGDDLETMRKVLQIVLNHVLTRESNWTAADGVEQQS